MASYYQNDYGYRRGEPTAAPQFVTSRGVDDVSSVKIHETRGWRTHSPDDGDLPDDRSFCSRFKFAIWAIVAVVIVAAIIALSVTMVEVQKNKHSSEADGEEYTPPGVLVPSSPGAGSSPGGANPNIGEPPGAPPASDNDGTLEIMSNPPFPVPAGYTALWWDEFEGNALDTQWWNYDIGYGQQYGLWAWGNQEQEYYTSDPSNVQVSNGVLKITAQRQQTVMPDGYTFQYTSGRINTKGKLAVFGGMTTKDGRQWNNIRIEASLQAPQPSESLGSRVVIVTSAVHACPVHHFSYIRTGFWRTVMWFMFNATALSSSMNAY